MQIRRILSAFKREENGSSTVETVLWFPAFVIIFVLAADVSFMFFGQNRAYRIIQDANRSLSVGRLGSEQEVVDRIKLEFSGFSPNAEVTTNIDDLTGTVVSVARIPASDLTATRLISAFTDLKLTVGARHYVEY